jgi:chorismate mutase
MADTQTTKSELWFSELAASNEALYIFGPCSAESRDQVVSVAKEIAKFHPKSIFRAGIWKPRTRPNNFEGVGEIGLSWLSEVQSETGMKVATEVANANHVELCLKAGIDALWLGARTTVNPFYVQEIAEALKGVNMPIFVKNPVAPDLNLWIGAIERLEKLGISQVAAIHRGFQNYDSKPYRNHPQWEIPIELMAKRPDVPIICDISHICGNPELFPTVAQKALDLNMAGLHIEVHPNPKAALSDAQQQITASDLRTLLSGLERRQVSIEDPDYQSLLDALRSQIDEVDEELIQNLFRRMEVIKKIGALKKENQITILQVNRWQKIVEHFMSEGKILGLGEDFLKGILNSIHLESMRNQNEIMNK